MGLRKISKRIVSLFLVIALVCSSFLTFAEDIVIISAGPIIESVSTENGRATVIAKNTDGTTSNLKYSFDNGNIWSFFNFQIVSKKTDFQVGVIQVKDINGNVTKNTQVITVDPVGNEDITAPIFKPNVEGYIVTIDAKDETKLHDEAYSFDGGVTWQASNIYNSNGVDKVWTLNQIIVRDAANNKSGNKFDVCVPKIEEQPDINAPSEFTLNIVENRVDIVITNKIEGAKYFYSFDGGKIWSTESFLVASKTQTIPANKIMVLNQADKISFELQDAYLECKKPIDTTGPNFTVKVKENNIIITHTDSDVLPDNPYSFDGGKTWVAGNMITVSNDPVEFPVNTFLMKNTDGSLKGWYYKVKAPRALDNTPPAFTYEVNGLKLIINATDNDELEKDAYSFDGGVTWTADNFYKIKQGTEKTFDVGQVVVRDYSGNFVSNVEQISLPAKDTVPPQIAISAVNATVTVTAVDETALHATPYSFDSGVTWQAGNSLTISGTKTWQAGEIKVRDAAGNITSSNTPITASDNSNTDCIDVSAYQGYIDWAKVKASGINSAIIRATTWSGGQTTSTGYWVVDPFFELNVKRAKDNGIKVGAYIYTYSFNTNEISQELAVFRATADRLKSEGYAFDLPVFVDYEYGKILNAVPSVADRTYLLEYEMACLGNAGYYSGMYMNTNWALNHVNARELQNKGFDMWIADFRGYNGYAPDVAFWQYTSTGSVSGVNGNCDISHSYKNYSDLIHGGSGGGGGSTPSETMFTVYDLNTNKPVTDTKLNIIAAITNNEVGNMSLSGEDFRNLCKAQAVAANSWLQHQYENQGTIPNVGLKYSGNYGAVKEAIFDVQSKVITYNGRTANTVYTSCNNGKTNSARNYLKTDAYPYLTVVDSPYDTQVFRNKTMTRNESQVANDIRKFSIDPYASGVAKSSWIQIIERDPQTNYVTRVSLCGQEVPISKFNENMIGPYSPDFNVNYSNGVWTFVANGNGHCMGLSQYGAYYYAIKPTKWYDILAIYFPGTKIEDRF